ncbi:D-alanine--D-alanine ligase [Sulfurivirga sp.]|uniref:D-alanine--D-alanine ligase n=1 Tax=Sulfurivirga sp. TaxID=2614236 RepID=UPI0025ED8A8A|nr:D-alanine--D-alanine ligase [Sulfurivirga sp.]
MGTEKKIAVLMGGVSEERPVSLRSGEAVLAALERQGVAARGFDVRTGEEVRRAAAWADGVFIALHGRWGEDGTVQALLDDCGVPYTGSGMAASALAMDKLRTKWVWRGAGLPTPDFLVVMRDAPFELSQLDFGFPVMVKPAREGSSIGIARADTPEALHTALEAALALDREVIIERWIEGAEYTVALVGEQVLPAIRIETPRTFYDYEAKYHSDQTRYHCPCGLDAVREGELAELAAAAFGLLGCAGWGRVDLMVDEQGRPWLIEVNTVPGMTDHSLVPMAARQYGWSFDRLVMEILAAAGLA